MKAIRSSAAAVLAVCSAVASSSGQVPALGKAERARVAFTDHLPQLKGDTLSVTVVEVNCGPGESSKPHSHPCPVIGYVLSGTLRRQVQGEPPAVYRLARASTSLPTESILSRPTRATKSRQELVAYFVGDHNAPLSTDVPDANPAGGSKP
jgi:hypothetical protein